MNQRMNALEIRKWITPYVMRYLLRLQSSGKHTVKHEEFVAEGIATESIQALLQTRRIKRLDDSTYEIDQL